MSRTVKVFAPATVANVVCGYDVLGFALDNPGDEVIMRLTDSPGIVLKKITGDNGRLPLAITQNTVSVSVQHYLNYIDEPNQGVEIELTKKMPIGSGLGSSSASTVAGLFAINKLFDNVLNPRELIPFAMKGEELACGFGHADNVAPAILGGFVLIRSYDPLDIIQLPYPENLYCAIIFPHVDVPTRDAREMIRKKIDLKDAVTQWGNIAGLISGLFMKDNALIARSMHDVLIEPTRAILIPNFYTMKQIALENGALSFGISGSGPSVFAFADTPQIAEKINTALQQHLQSLNIGCNTYLSPINATGPCIVEQDLSLKTVSTIL